MLSDVDSKGTFNGNGQMTRTQAAVVMDRLIEVCSGSSTPEIPAGGVQILPGASAITDIKNGIPIDGGYEFDTSGAINAAGTDRLASMEIRLDGKYSTLTFTVTACDVGHAVGVNSLDNSLQPALLTEETRGGVKAGESRTYIINVSGVNDVGIRMGSYIAHATVTNIALN